MNIRKSIILLALAVLAVFPPAPAYAAPDTAQTPDTAEKPKEVYISTRILRVGGDGDLFSSDMEKLPLSKKKDIVEFIRGDRGEITAVRRTDRKSPDELIRGKNGEAAWLYRVDTKEAEILAVLTNDSADKLLRAFMQKKNVDLISAPHVTTKDKTSATVEVVREFKNSGESIDKGVSVNVEPTIVSEDVVRCNIEIRHTTVTSCEKLEGTRTPLVHMRIFHTEIAVPSGATVLLASRADTAEFDPSKRGAKGFGYTKKAKVAQLFEDISAQGGESKYEYYFLVKTAILENGQRAPKDELPSIRKLPVQPAKAQ